MLTGENGLAVTNGTLLTRAVKGVGRQHNKMTSSPKALNVSGDVGIMSCNEE